jgi:hypothetical protein
MLCSALRYVLLHHVMGGLEGTQGAWGYVQGGMGALSDAIASSATAHGASIFTEKVRTLSPYPDYWLRSRIEFGVRFGRFHV